MFVLQLKTLVILLFNSIGQPVDDVTRATLPSTSDAVTVTMTSDPGNELEMATTAIEGALSFIIKFEH